MKLNYLLHIRIVYVFVKGILCNFTLVAIKMLLNYHYSGQSGKCVRQQSNLGIGPSAVLKLSKATLS